MIKEYLAMGSMQGGNKEEMGKQFQDGSPYQVYMNQYNLHKSPATKSPLNQDMKENLSLKKNMIGALG